MRKLPFALGVFALLLFVPGSILWRLHYWRGTWMMVIGILLFLFGSVLPILIDKITIESRKVARTALILLFIIVLSTLGFWLTKNMHWPGANAFGQSAIILIMVFFLFFAKQLEGRKLKIRSDRQLAAILFTDIVGFTSLMGKDENKALQYLEQNRRIQKKLIRKYRGKWLKEMGDGSIAIFFTSSEAVLCAIEIQDEINIKTSIKLRMGIQVSEIVFSDSDVFGDGVNVASRISECAGSGEIYFSEAVYNNIRNREELEVIPVGEKELKNVAYKLNLHKIVTQ
ncbi:adenylate/guanylate cyclase domain-containing protein [Bacteroidota bacterium]